MYICGASIQSSHGSGQHQVLSVRIAHERDARGGVKLSVACKLPGGGLRALNTLTAWHRTAHRKCCTGNADDGFTGSAAATAEYVSRCAMSSNFRSDHSASTQCSTWNIRTCLRQKMGTYALLLYEQWNALMRGGRSISIRQSALSGQRLQIHVRTY